MEKELEYVKIYKQPPFHVLKTPTSNRSRGVLDQAVSSLCRLSLSPMLILCLGLIEERIVCKVKHFTNLRKSMEKIVIDLLQDNQKPYRIIDSLSVCTLLKLLVFLAVNESI